MKNEILEDRTVELEIIKVEVFTEIDKGNLVSITVGGEKGPATKSDIGRVSKVVEGIMDEYSGVLFVVVPHTIKVQYKRQKKKKLGDCKNEF